MVWFQQKFPRRKNKYNARSSVYNGVYYHSQLEAGFARDLDLRKKAGDIKDWKRQIPIDFYIEKKILNLKEGIKICRYYVDFQIIHNDKTIEWVEVKGFQTDLWRFKWKLFEAFFGNEPNMKLTVIK